MKYEILQKKAETTASGALPLIFSAAILMRACRSILRRLEQPWA
jgi:hypothetical protein